MQSAVEGLLGLGSSGIPQEGHTQPRASIDRLKTARSSYLKESNRHLDCHSSSSSDIEAGSDREEVSNEGDEDEEDELEDEEGKLLHCRWIGWMSNEHFHHSGRHTLSNTT